jgi:hypothetical protein
MAVCSNRVHGTSSTLRGGQGWICHNGWWSLSDLLQHAAHIFTNLGRVALLDLKRQLYDGSLQGELIFVDLE